jgi:small-conductance mechanosensitive channel
MNDLSHWDFLIPVSVTMGVWIAGLIARRYLFRYLHRLAEQTEWEFDDIIIRIIRSPFVIWTLMLGIYIALQISRLPKVVVSDLGRVFSGLAILSVTLVAANILAEFIRRSATKAQVATPQLIPNIAKIFVIGIGLLVLLGTWGIQITPILTAFGIGGLAVALALQDTLSNLFAGFYTTLAKQVRVGDFIKLDSGPEGQVVDISWRTTTVRNPLNNLIIIPNTKLSQSVITNYALPEPALTLRLPVSVSYEAEPEDIERVLLEVAKSAEGEVPGLAVAAEPEVRLTGFGESGLEFALIVCVRAFQDEERVAHELRKRIFKRLRAEKIKI